MFSSIFTFKPLKKKELATSKSISKRLWQTVRGFLTSVTAIISNKLKSIIKIYHMHLCESATYNNWEQGVELERCMSGVYRRLIIVFLMSVLSWRRPVQSIHFEFPLLMYHFKNLKWTHLCAPMCFSANPPFSIKYLIRNFYAWVNFKPEIQLHFR